jgi:hypothetical protein
VTWRAEEHDGRKFYRLEVTRYDERLALVCGPTADGRYQVRCGGWRRDTREIAEVGDLLTVEASGAAARTAALAWADSV